MNSWATCVRWTTTLTEGTDRLMSVYLLAKVEGDEVVVVARILQQAGEGDAGHGQKVLNYCSWS